MKHNSFYRRIEEWACDQPFANCVQLMSGLILPRLEALERSLVYSLLWCYESLFVLHYNITTLVVIAYESKASHVVYNPIYDDTVSKLKDKSTRIQDIWCRSHKDASVSRSVFSHTRMPANLMIRVTHIKVILSDRNCLVAQYLIQISATSDSSDSLMVISQSCPIYCVFDTKQWWLMFLKRFIVQKGKTNLPSLAWSCMSLLLRIVQEWDCVQVKTKVALLWRSPYADSVSYVIRSKCLNVDHSLSLSLALISSFSKEYTTSWAF